MCFFIEILRMTVHKVFNVLLWFNKRSQQKVSNALFSKVASILILSANAVALKSTVYKTILPWQILDSWVNTALLPLFPSGLTGLETSWALLTIATWLRLLPSSAWLRLYLRVFGQANPNLRSYLMDWTRCSLQFLWPNFFDHFEVFCLVCICWRGLVVRAGYS